METRLYSGGCGHAYRSYPTYEEWKPTNIEKPVEIITVLILPMRNGNTSTFSFSFSSIISSYPTYEEWKLLFIF